MALFRNTNRGANPTFDYKRNAGTPPVGSSPVTMNTPPTESKRSVPTNPNLGSNDRTIRGGQYEATRTPPPSINPVYGAPIGQSSGMFNPDMISQYLDWINGDDENGGPSDASGYSPAAIASAKQYSAQSDALRSEALAAALQAIAADYDVQEGMLGAEQDTFSNIFAGEQADIKQGRGRAREGAWAAGTDRGLLRSGIMQQGLVAADQPFADRTAENIARYNPEEGALGSEYRRIESALKLMAQQEQAQVREARVDSERQQLDSDQQLAMLLAGMGG